MDIASLLESEGLHVPSCRPDSDDAAAHKNAALAALTISIIPINRLNLCNCSLPEFQSHLWIVPNPTYGVNRQLIFTL